MKEIKVNALSKTITSGFKLVGLVIIFLVTVPTVLAASSVPTFNDLGFASIWNRVDKPLLDLPGGAGRGYTWGPAIAQAAGVTKEVYNGEQRTVQYFDKARMEVNNPSANPKDLFYVTTGLLVKELVTGNRQDGANSFSHHQPSVVQVAGDTNEAGGNQIAPTYASFQELVGFTGFGNFQPSKQGQTVNQRINRAGEVTSFLPPEQRLVAGYDEVTRHNIPDVFVTFANSSGPIWNGITEVTGKVLFDNPLYVLGRPITEAYWTRAVVQGIEQDVLVQLFERRVLTYTPANPAAFKVEMGNVGQHYYRWRYTEADATHIVNNQDKNHLTNPSVMAVDGQGNIFVLSAETSRIAKYNAQGQLLVRWGGYGGLSGQFNGTQSIATDRQGNLYVPDPGNNRVEIFDNNGNFVREFPCLIFDPTDLAVDQQGNIFVTNGSDTIQKLDNSGHLLTSFGPKVGGLNGSSKMILDEAGNIYLLCWVVAEDPHLEVASLQKFDNNGKFLTEHTNSTSFMPQLLAYGGSGQLYFVAENSTLSGTKIVKFDSGSSSFKTFLDEGVLNNGNQPGALAGDNTGNLLIALPLKGVIRRVDGAGNIISEFNF